MFYRGCSFSIQSILERHGCHKGRQTVFFTPPNPFGGDSDEEEPRGDYTVPQKVHHHSHWKRNQDAVYWVKLAWAQDQGLQFLQNKVTCDHLERQCASRVYLQSCLSKRRSNTVRKSLNSKTTAQSHTEKQVAIAAAAAVVLWWRVD